MYRPGGTVAEQALRAAHLWEGHLASCSFRFDIDLLAVHGQIREGGGRGGHQLPQVLHCILVDNGPPGYLHPAK